MVGALLPGRGGGIRPSKGVNQARCTAHPQARAVTLGERALFSQGQFQGRVSALGQQLPQPREGTGSTCQHPAASNRARCSSSVLA